MIGKEFSKQHRVIKFVAELSIDRSSQVLSKMLRCGSRIELSNIGIEDITSFSQRMFQHNSEITGALIDLIGDTPFKFLFWVDLSGALLLTDLFIRREPGTTKDFNSYVESTIQEIGNILSSSITNVFSKDFDIQMKPSPPKTFNDFSGSIFSEMIQEIAKDVDSITIIETVFKVVKHEINCSMFILPEQGSIETLDFLTGTI